MARSAAVLAASLLALLSTARAAGEQPLGLVEVDLRFPSPARVAKSGEARGRVDLRGDFVADAALRSFRASSETLRIAVGDVTLLEGPAFAGRTKVGARGRWGLVVRSREPWGRGSAVSLRMDLGNGEFLLRARGVDLAGMAATGPGPTPVEVVLGERAIGATADLEADGPRTWRLRPRTGGTDVPPPAPGPPPDGEPLWWQHMVGLGGAGTPPWGDHTAVIDSQAALDAAMAQVGLFVPWPVDFQQSRVVVIYLGARPSWGYGPQVTAVRSKGFGAEVLWTEWQPAPGCPDKMETIHWTYFTRIQRTAGPVVFTKSVQQKACAGP